MFKTENNGKFSAVKDVAILKLRAWPEKSVGSGDKQNSPPSKPGPYMPTVR